MQHIEYEEQKKLFQWAKMYEKRYPMLKYLNSSQNGIKAHNVREAARAKATGMRAGFPDVFLPYPYYETIQEQKAPTALSMSGKKISICNAVETKMEIKYCGLFIELKRPIRKGYSKPVISPEQKEWLEYLNAVGYYAIVCYGCEEAIKIISNYLKIPLTN